MITSAQFTISVINDGNGISSVEVTYAIGSSPTTPPGDPLTDGGAIVTDMNGEPLTTANWSTTIPVVPQGSYLWTRTMTIFGDG